MLRDFIGGGWVEVRRDGDEIGAVRNDPAPESDAGVRAQVTLEVVAVHLESEVTGL